MNNNYRIVGLISIVNIGSYLSVMALYNLYNYNKIYGIPRASSYDPTKRSRIENTLRSFWPGKRDFYSDDYM